MMNRHDAGAKGLFGARAGRVVASPIAVMPSVAAAILLLAGAAWFAVAQAQLPPSQTYQGVEYVSGGFGEDSADAFKAAQSSYPLALTFAAVDEDGGARPYVAEVRVVVKRQGSGEVVLDVPSAGPYLLARVEPGDYDVDATYQGETQTQRVSIGQNGGVQKTITWKRK